MSWLQTLSLKDRAGLYDVLFQIGVGWRILYGFLRLILGFFLLHLVGTSLSDLFLKVMSHELVEDPNDFLIQIVSPLLQHLSLTVTYFLAAYLLFWGIIDIFLSINLLKDRMWAFPVSIYLIGAFVLYEIYRFSYTHSFVLLGVIVVDVVLIWLIREKYQKLQRALSTAGV